MKKAFLALSVALLLLATLLALPAFAAEDAQTNMEDVLTYDGLAARTKDNGGIRSVYTIDRDAVAALEDAGYRVAYGAVMGIGTYKGNVVNTTRSLAVNGDFEHGFSAANNNASAIVVYATGAPDYVTGVHLDDTDTAFAYTTTFPEADAAKYGIELVYAGFVSVVDANGEQTVLYDYAEGNLFGKEGSSYGAATSLLELADWFVNNYDKSDVKAYHYNNNTTLRNVLITCGEEIRTVSAPVVLTAIDGEVSLSKTLSSSYVEAAREAYKTPAYADYTTSIIANYSTTSSAYNDRPNPVSISWIKNGTESLTYTLTVATDASFTQNVRVMTTTDTTQNVYNLFTNTTYYYKVEAVTADGYSFETAASTFKTADTVRWIYVDGVRNVRDIGGWNGLNQGLVYRGSELNLVGSHGLQITDAGIAVTRDQLGVKTDLDFRAADENGSYGTSSPLGETAVWVNYPIGNFLSAFSTSYANTMRLFIDYDNYPVYMHCWGGADRTGTVAFMLSGLCGASEEDLAIDLELTSFASFGYRYRYDNAAYLYASTVARLKTYNGNTLQEKFESCFKETYGFTEAEISNIQAINTQSGAVYDFADGERGNVYYNSSSDESFSFSFVMRNSTRVTSVTVDGVALNFSFDSASSTLTVYGDQLVSNNVLAGVGEILFDDGAHLRFYIETDLVTKLAAEILAGNYALLFDGADAETADGIVTLRPNGSFQIPSQIAYGLYNAGYESVTATLPAGVTVWIYSNANTLLSSQIIEKDQAVVLPLNGGKIVFTCEANAVAFSQISMNPIGASWVDTVAGGDYKAFFGTGENTINQAGDPILNVTSSNFTVNATTIAKLTALGYSHMTFTVDIAFAEGTTGCYMAIRHGGKSYERLYPALKAADGCVKATVTIQLDDTTVMQLITRTCTVSSDGTINDRDYTAAQPDSFVISGVSFAKSGTEGAVDKHPVPDPNREYVERVNGGAYNELFPTGTLSTDKNGNPIQVIEVGNFIVDKALLAKALAAGYSYITFKVAVDLPDGVTEGFICVRMNGEKYETKYTAFKTTDGEIYAQATLPISESTTNLQFISRADYTVDGSVNLNSHDQVNATFTFSEVAFLQSGTVGATAIEKTLLDKIEEGEYVNLFDEGAVTVDGDQFIKTTGSLAFTHKALRELYEAGYTTLSFRATVNFTGPVSDADARIRMLARWSVNGKANYLKDDTHDITASQYPSIGTAFITIHLTEEHLGENNCFVLVPQTGENIVVKNIVLCKAGETPVEPTEPEEPEVPVEKTTAERIADGEWNLLIGNEASNYTFENGAIVKNTGVIEFQFSNAALEELRAAGYTKVTFTMSAQDENLARIVCRWKKDSSWVTNDSNQQKNDLSPATNGQTKTVTFNLTEFTSGAGWYIAIQVQKTGNLANSENTLTLTNFTFS